MKVNLIFKVQDALGSPIKVTAESGGRRVFQIKHKFALEDSRLTLVLNYYLEGPKNKGTVVCKVFKVSKWEKVFLFFIQNVNMLNFNFKNESKSKFEYEYVIVNLEYIHNGNRRIVVRKQEE